MNRELFILLFWPVDKNSLWAIHSIKTSSMQHSINVSVHDGNEKLRKPSYSDSWTWLCILTRFWDFVWPLAALLACVREEGWRVSGSSGLSVVPLRLIIHFLTRQLSQPALRGLAGLTWVWQMAKWAQISFIKFEKKKKRNSTIHTVLF